MQAECVFCNISKCQENFWPKEALGLKKLFDLGGGKTFEESLVATAVRSAIVYKMKRALAN
jgi:hypothetical protein